MFPGGNPLQPYPPAQIDPANAEQLRRALAAVSADHAVVVVDMTASELCDPSGIRALVVARKRACARAGEIVLVMPGPAAHQMSELAGTGGLFRIFDSVPAAVAFRRRDLAGDDHSRAG